MLELDFPESGKTWSHTLVAEAAKTISRSCVGGAPKGLGNLVAIAMCSSGVSPACTACVSPRLELLDALWNPNAAWAPALC